jgi:STE24 endopeptidase
MNEDKATRYHRLKRRTRMLSLVWTAAALALLLATGASAVLRDAAVAISALAVPASWTAAFTVPVFAAALVLFCEIGCLPIALQRFRLDRRYGLSSQRLIGWLGDQARALILGALLSTVAASVVYGWILLAPGVWWLPAGLTIAAGLLVLATVAPLVLLPVFWRVRPLTREPLRGRLLALADRAGTSVVDVYEWGLGAKARKANAVLVGIGASRRILITDTMLAEHSDDEIEVVIGHELAHHARGDIWKGIAFEAAVVIASLYASAGVLQKGLGPLALRGPADVAGMPVLPLVAGAVYGATLPLRHGLSRALERRADRFALELTKNPNALISTLRRLGAQNLAETDPSRMVQWLFGSHPSVGERIAAAQAFTPSLQRREPVRSRADTPNRMSGGHEFVDGRRRSVSRHRPAAAKQRDVLRNMPLFPRDQSGVEDCVDGEMLFPANDPGGSVV